MLWRGRRTRGTVIKYSLSVLLMWYSFRHKTDEFPRLYGTVPLLVGYYCTTLVVLLLVNILSNTTISRMVQTYINMMKILKLRNVLVYAGCIFILKVRSLNNPEGLDHANSNSIKCT